MSNQKKIHEEDEILVEDITNTESEMQNLREGTRKVNENKRIESVDQLKHLIHSYEPPEIKDWPKIPYKTIFVIFLLLFSSILFLYNAVQNFKNPKGKFKDWFSFGLLGGLLIIPGVFYTFYLLNILIGTEGYDYDSLPDLSQN